MTQHAQRENDGSGTITVHGHVQYGSIPSWIFDAVRDKKINHTAACLYGWIMLRYSGMAGVFPKHSSIAAEFGVSLTTTRDALRGLRRIGAITWTEQYLGNGAQTSNRYILAWLGPYQFGPGAGDTPPVGNPTPPPTPCRNSDTPPVGIPVPKRQTEVNQTEDLLLLPPPADPPVAPEPQEEEATPEETPGTTPPVEALTAAVHDTATRLAPNIPPDTLTRACARLPRQGWTPELLAAAVQGHDWSGAGPGALVTWLRHLDAPVTRASGTGRRPAFTACPEHPEHPAGRCPECAKECVPAGGRLRKARRTSTRVPGILVQ
jgi:hypothetical protein